MWFSFFSRISCVKPFHYFFPEDKIYFSCVKLNKNDIFFLSWIFFFFISWCHTWKKRLKKERIIQDNFSCVKTSEFIFFFFQNNVTNKNSECLSAREKCFLLFVMCETEWKCLYFILFKVILFYFFCTNVFFHLLRHMNNSLWINLMYNFLLSKHIFK